MKRSMMLEWNIFSQKFRFGDKTDWPALFVCGGVWGKVDMCKRPFGYEPKNQVVILFRMPTVLLRVRASY